MTLINFCGYIKANLNELQPKGGIEVKKNEPSQKKDRLPIKVLLGLQVLTLIVFIAGFVHLKQDEKTLATPPVETPMFLDRDHSSPNINIITAKASPQKVHPLLTPVFIVGDNRFCSGVLYPNENGEAEIITASHMFSTATTPSTYSYTPIVSDGLGLRPINRLEPVNNLSTEKRIDVVRCIPGPRSVIKGIFNTTQAAQNFREGDQFFKIINEDYLISLLTGQPCRIIGITKSTDKGKELNGEQAPNFLFAYSAIQGESGSGFLTRNGDLVILSQIIEIEPGSEIDNYFRDVLPPGSHNMALGYVLQNRKQ